VSDIGARADADAAVDATVELLRQARATLTAAVQEAPVDEPEHAETHHHRPPGALRESARLVLIVNEHAFPEAEAAQAFAMVRELAGQRRLYRIDAELRFETPYARRQHDQLDLHHRHGGRAKYLETPIKAAAGPLAGALRRAMSRQAGPVGGRFRRHA
jgi:hypothetical protein